MKSEERHKLQQNALADWLARVIKAAIPYRNPILLALLALVFVAVWYVVWTRTWAASTSQAWDEVNSDLGSGELAKLADVAQTFPRTTAGCTAAVVAGDWHLAEGCNRLFVNRALANQEFAKAIENYDMVLQWTQIPSLRERATFGLARAREAKGELERAGELYKEVVEKWPQGAFAGTAANRLKDLERSDTKAFYDRFAKFDPKPVLSKEPGAAGEKPASDVETLPSEPPSSVNDVKLDDSASSMPAQTESAETKPAE